MLSRRDALKLSAAGLIAPVIGTVTAPGISAMGPGNIAEPGDLRGPDPTQPIVVKWRQESGGRVFYPPKTIGGRVYITKQNTLYSLDVVTGEELWAFPATHDPAHAADVAGSMVFVTSQYRAGASLHALDIESGEEVWQVESAPGGGISNPAILNDILYTGVDDATYALEASSGREIWSFQHTGEFIGTSPLVDDDTIFVGNWYGTLQAIDRNLGTGRWTFNTDGPAGGLLLEGNTLLCKAGEHVLLALESTTGKELWRFTAGDTLGSPASENGTVYFWCEDQNLYALDVATGNERWRFPTDGYSSHIPSIANGTVYLQAGPDFIALEASSGQMLWRYSSGIDRIYHDHTVTSDVTYLSSSLNLYAIDTVSGQEIWRYPLEHDMVGIPALAVADGSIYIVNKNTHLYALGNLLPTLIKSTIIRGAPSARGVEVATVNAGDEIATIWSRQVTGGAEWAEVTIGQASGWIPAELIGTATPPDNVEYVYVP